MGTITQYEQNHDLVRYSGRLSTALENNLNESVLDYSTERERVIASVKACRKALDKLRAYVSRYGFSSRHEEIFFFREIKPVFYSKYIYFSRLHNFLINRPPGGIKETQAYIQVELSDLRRFFEQNHGFYQYYRSGSNELDDLYFRRNAFSSGGTLEDHVGDQVFSTPRDFTLSKLLAHEKYQDYLNVQLRYLSEGLTEHFRSEVSLRWTASKTDLVELIYALVEAGVLNNGTMEIKNAMVYFQRIFQVDLHSYYQKFGSIIDRKKDHTVFLDRLRDCLKKRITEKLDEPTMPELQPIRFSRPKTYHSGQKKAQGWNKSKPRKGTTINSRGNQRK